MRLRQWCVSLVTRLRISDPATSTVRPVLAFLSHHPRLGHAFRVSILGLLLHLARTISARAKTYTRTHTRTHTHTHTHTQSLNHSLTHAWACAPSANISDSDVTSPTQKQCRQISLFTSPTTTPLPERSRLYRGGFDHTNTSLPP